MKKVWILCAFLAMPLSALDHDLVIRFNGQVDINTTLSQYQVISSFQLANNSLYHVRISSNLTSRALISDLYSVTGLKSAEVNHAGTIVGAEAASHIDQRPINVLDQRPINVLDSDPDAGTTETLFAQDFIKQTQINSVWPDTTGAGVTVAILDTGIDTAHSFLSSAISPNGYDFVDDDADPSEERNGIDTNQNGLLDEGWGHGSHIAGIIRTVAPDATILPIRIVDGDGFTDIFRVIQGLEYALKQGADVINLSFSIPNVSPAFEDWVEKLKNQDVMIVTSAGNNNNDNLYFPAMIKSVMTVASVDAGNVKSSFSNYGKLVDICAPGEDVLGPLPGGDFIYRSGTSMAAPIVSGIAALGLSLDSGLSHHKVFGLIEHRGQDIDAQNPKYKNLLGGGLVDAAETLKKYL